MTGGDTVQFCLGLQINVQHSSITIKQNTYVQGMLTRFGMCDAKATTTTLPEDWNSEQSLSTELLDDRGQRWYRQVIGTLMYIMVASRPDIAHALGFLSRSLSSPREAHRKFAKHLLRYMKGTSNLGLTYTKSKIEPSFLTAYCDADHAGDWKTGDVRSTSGILVRALGSAIHWKSTKQTLITSSTVEAEYVAMSEAVKDLNWLCETLLALGIDTRPVPLHVDNRTAVAIGNGTADAKRSKHICIRFHIVRQHIEEGNVKVEWISTGLQKADGFTKKLDASSQSMFVSFLGLTNISK